MRPSNMFLLASVTSAAVWWGLVFSIRYILTGGSL